MFDNAALRRKFSTSPDQTGRIGAAPASAPFARLQQRIALVVVALPFLGFLIAVVLLWERSVGVTELGIFIGMYAATILGIGAGYHRHFAHRSFETTGSIRIALAILGSMDAQGPVLFWTAIHRRHHKYSDQPGDPHSPYAYGEGLWGLLRGLWHAHVGWLFVSEVTDWGHYVPDLLKDSALFRINQLYFLWIAAGLVIPGIIGGAISGTWSGFISGLLWGGLVRIFFGHHATWSVNSICHVYGSRPYRASDGSANNVWLALLTFGEAWHNNHHAFPSSALHGLEWWQFDLSGWFIRLLRRFHLAWNVKVPSQEVLAARKIP